MQELPYWLRAIFLRGIGPKKFIELLANFSDIKNLFAASDAELKTLHLTNKQIQSLRETPTQKIQAELAWVNDKDRHIIAINDADYPEQLKQIADPPLVLYVRGSKSALKTQQLAIVGARGASISGLKYAAYFAEKLASSGVTITSGLALGIDSAAHAGALSANGITLAVAGTGLSIIYPQKNFFLAEKIYAQNGAIVSEFPLTMQALPANFPRRNRIISGLSLGVLVIEAALKSGSLITARHALEAGREVFAMPGALGNPFARGCHHLIKQGATLVDSIEDILQALPNLQINTATCLANATQKSAQKLTKLSAANLQILTQIEYELTSFDVILLRSGLTANKLSSILLTLELEGYILSLPGGYVRITS